MDEYEEFMDKYVDFMKSYDANDVTMLSEYTELLSQYNTYMDKVSKLTRTAFHLLTLHIILMLQTE